MRNPLLVLTCVLLLLPSAAAEDPSEASAALAPTEAEAVAATRSLLLVMRTVDMPERGDLQRRFLDSGALLSRIFGAKAEGLPLTVREAVVRVIASRLRKATKAIRGRHVRAAKFVCSTLPDGVRRVGVRTPSPSLSFLWVRGKGGPLLVDWGTSSAKSQVSLLKREWLQTKSTPEEFLSDLLALVEHERQVKLSRDHILTIVTLLIVRRVEEDWKPYNGKNFVLSLVACNDLDRRDPRNLGILFSPADKRLSLASTDLERYKAVSQQTLREAGAFSALTSYAGRRNAERDFAITPKMEKVGAPLVADVSFPDIAIVGSSDGSVRIMDRAALGLDPKDPIVVGDASKSEILRTLSDK